MYLISANNEDTFSLLQHMVQPLHWPDTFSLLHYYSSHGSALALITYIQSPSLLFSTWFSPCTGPIHSVFIIIFRTARSSSRSSVRPSRFQKNVEDDILIIHHTIIKHDTVPQSLCITSRSTAACINLTPQPHRTV